MQKSMNAYVKTISKRSELEAKEKILPIAYMGGTMITHGSDFEPDSEYGQCLNCETTHVRFQWQLTDFHSSVGQNGRAPSADSRKLHRLCERDLVRIS
jgi:hypothetical protein